MTGNTTPTATEKISRLRRLHGMLEFDPLETEQEFSEVMHLVFNVCEVDKNCLHEIKGFDATAIDGWLMGRLPHKAFWPAITLVIMTAISNHIHDCEGKPRLTSPLRPYQDTTNVVPISSRRPVNDEPKQ